MVRSIQAALRKERREVLKQDHHPKVGVSFIAIFSTLMANFGSHDASLCIIDTSIGFLGAFAIGVNSLCGPALLQLPFQYQQSGIIPTTVCLIVVGALAYFVTMHMSNVVSQVPGNDKFQKTVEFSDPFETFWSRRAFLACQWYAVRWSSLQTLLS